VVAGSTSPLALCCILNAQGDPAMLGHPDFVAAYAPVQAADEAAQRPAATPIASPVLEYSFNHLLGLFTAGAA
jgi:hypothetical protein